MTQAPATVIHAGLGITEGEAQRLYCEAFKQALDVYCDPTKCRKPRGIFNNYFFDALKSLPPPNTAAGQQLANATLREMPILVGAVTGTAQAVAGAPAMAGSVGPVAQALATAHSNAAAALGATGGLVTGGLGGLVRSCLAIGAMLGKGVLNWGILRLAGTRLKFPDGMVGNRILEIKGPFDKHKPKQQQAYKDFAGGVDPMVADMAVCMPGQKKKCPRRV
ncbi:MAG: hypothetical protein WKG00_03660 [Polyangiaceae bacterium]